MRVGGVYRHSNCLDIDIFVDAITYVGTNYIKLKVTYFDQRSRAIYNLDPDKITIYHKDQKKWKEVDFK